MPELPTAGRRAPAGPRGPLRPLGRAEDAFRLGLVSEVVEPERLLDATLARAEQVSRVAPLATRELLRLIRTALESPLEEGLSREQEALARLHRTADAAEGVRAFMEKRPASFTGE